MPDKKPYVPFCSARDSYDSTTDIQLDRILNAFFTEFRISKFLLKADFREYIERIMASHYPDLKCSPARAVMEGRIPGVPRMIDDMPPMTKKKIQHCLILMDLFETIVYEYVETVISSQKEGVQRAIRIAKKSLGSTRLPRLLDEILKGPKKEKSNEKVIA